MDFDAFARKVDSFLYHRTFRKLTESELKLAETWSLNLIRKNNPTWTEDQVRHYYDSLIKVRSYAVDEWGRRMN